MCLVLHLHLSSILRIWAIRINSVSFKIFWLRKSLTKICPVIKKDIYLEDKLSYDKEMGPYYNYILDWHTASYEYLSPGLQKLTGYSEEFFEQGIETLFSAMHPNDISAFQKIVHR